MNAQPNAYEFLWDKFIKMSQSKKEKLQFGWGAFVSLLLLANLFGMIDIRAVVDGVKALPQIQQELRSQSKRIETIEEVLKRNHLGAIRSGEELSTASYE